MKNFSIRKPHILIAITWLSVQLILLSNGIGIKNEASKYIEQANLLIDNNAIEGKKYVFYLTPILIIALNIALKLNFLFTVIIQMFLNAISTVAYYFVSKSLSDSHTIAFGATTLLVLFIPYQAWNVFLYTESVFLSLSLLLFYSITVDTNKRDSFNFQSLIILIFLIFTRPLGLLYIPSLAIFYFHTSAIRLSLKILISLLIICAVYISVNYIYTSGNDMDILKPIEDGNVICFSPTKYSDSTLELQRTNNPVYNLVFYIINNPLHFLKLSLLRGLSFFNLYRSDYSSFHNLFLILTMIFIYTGILLALFKKSVLFKKVVIAYFFLPLLLLFVVGVMIQCDDYDSRFSMPLFPMFILFSVDGWYSLKKPFGHRQVKSRKT